MTNIKIFKDTDETLVLTFNDYTLSDTDTAVFKFAKKWGGVPLSSVQGVIDPENNAFVFNLGADLTSDVYIEREVGEFVYEIEVVLSVGKKVAEHGSLIIHNTL